MAVFVPPTYSQIDFGDAFVKGILVFPVIYYLFFLASILIISPSGFYESQQVKFNDLDSSTYWQCLFNIPTLLSGTAKTCIQITEDIGVGSKIQQRLILSIITSTLLTSLYLWTSRKYKTNLHHVRGNERLDGKEAHNYLRAFSHNESRSSSTKLDILPYLSISEFRAAIHTAVLGGTGSGKTQIILAYLIHIIKQNNKMVLHDVKGDFTSWLKGALILSPADDRTAVWDIGADIDSRPAIVDFANFLVPDTEGAKDQFWSKAARILLVAFLTKLTKEKKREWGWYDLAGITLYQAEDWLELLEEYAPEGIEYIENSGSNLSIGVRAELKSHFGLIADIANAWGIDADEREKISFQQWLLEDDPENRIIIIQNNAEIKEQSKLWIGAFFNYAIKFAVGPRRSKHAKTPNWFIVDEINSMTRQESITDIINLGREKKSYLFLGCQTISLLYKKYSVEEIETWLNSIGTLWIGKHGRGGGADKAAALAGRSQIERRDVSAGYNRDTKAASTNHGYRGEMQQVVLASQLSAELGKFDAPYEHIKISVLGFGEKFCVVDIPITKPKEKQEGYIPSPWMKSDGFKRIRVPELEAAQEHRKQKAKAEKDAKRQKEALATELARVQITEQIVQDAAKVVIQTISEVASADSVDDADEVEEPPKKTKAELEKEKRQRIVATVSEAIIEDTSTDHKALGENIEKFAMHTSQNKNTKPAKPSPAPSRPKRRKPVIKLKRKVPSQ